MSMDLVVERGDRGIPFPSRGFGRGRRLTSWGGRPAADARGTTRAEAPYNIDWAYASNKDTGADRGYDSEGFQTDKEGPLLGGLAIEGPSATALGPGFPLEDWKKVLRWLEIQEVPSKLYFLAMLARDFCISKEELQVLPRHGVNVYRFDFSFKQQSVEFKRRILVPKLSLNDVKLLKRDMMRLGFNCMPTVNAIINRWYDSQEVPEKIPHIPIQQLLLRYQNIPILDKDRLHPSDATHLGAVFPIIEWRKVSDWAISIYEKGEPTPVRERIVWFLKKLFSRLGAWNTSVRQQFDVFSRNIQNRCFGAEKQAKEVRRRKWKSVMEIKTARMLKSQSLRHGNEEPFVEFLVEKFEGACTSTVLNVEAELQAFIEDVVGGK